MAFFIATGFHTFVWYTFRCAITNCCAMKNETTIEVLNDLIKINNDRIAGYERAAENIDQSEVLLKTLFYQLAEESGEFKRELTEREESMGAKPASDTTPPGQIYR